MSRGQEEGHHQDGARMEASAHHPRSALSIDRGEPCEATSHLPASRSPDTSCHITRSRNQQLCQ